MSLKPNIEEYIEADVKALGYEIEYIEQIKEGTSNILRIVIDKAEGSINTDDCEKVSRAIEEKIDKVVKLENYVLEVSSPGLERQLKSLKLYQKYIGSNILVKLYKKVLDKKEYIGVLESVENSGIVILSNNEHISLDFTDIASANTIYDFEKECI